MISDANRLKIV